MHLSYRKDQSSVARHRKAFEQWVRLRHAMYDQAGWQGQTPDHQLRRESEDGTYSDLFTHSMWIGWLAGADHVLATK